MCIGIPKILSGHMVFWFDRYGRFCFDPPKLQVKVNTQLRAQIFCFFCHELKPTNYRCDLSFEKSVLLNSPNVHPKEKLPLKI